MANLLQVFAVLTSPAGSATYHIISLFALEAAFAIAVGHWWRLRGEAHTGRLAFATFTAGAARGILFLTATIGATGIFPVGALLPVADRAVSLATIVLLAWALTFRRGHLIADLFMAMLLVGTLVMSIALGFQWYSFGAAGIPYNPYDSLWGFVKIAVLLFTLFLLVIVRQQDWPISLFIFLTLLFGVGFHLLNPIRAESYPAPERMMELIAFPLLVVILYRQALGTPPLVLPVPTPISAPAPETVAPPPPPISPPTIELVKPKTLTPQAATALLSISLAEPEDIVARVTEAVGKTLLADLTLVLSPPDQEEGGMLACVGGYDLIREKNTAGFLLPATKINTVASAIQRGRPLRLRLSAHRSELLAIADALGVSPFESAAMIPLRTPEKNFGAILIVAPHSQKDWSNEEHALLASLATPIASALVKVVKSATPSTVDEPQLKTAQERIARLTEELQLAQAEIKRQVAQTESLAAIIQAQPSETPSQVETIEALNKQLTTTRDEARTALAAIDSTYQKQIDQLNGQVVALNQQLATAQDETKKLSETQALLLTDVNTTHREEIQRLTKEIALLAEQLDNAQSKVKQLSTASTAPLSEDTVLQADLKRARQEISSLNQQLTGAEIEIESLRIENRQLSEIRTTALFSSLASQAAEIAARIQDLRQPLASIVGYTDMLLGEAVGILGSSQKGLLERIKVGTERMTLALDDLVRAASMSTTSAKQESSATKVAEIVQEAAAHTSAPFKAKQIVLRTQLADKLPTIAADHDAVQQILVRLLANACEVSEAGSEVLLSARSQNDEYILLSVRDTGESLPPEEQDRIFTRIYKDSGLSVAKALTEAHGGRIWLESNGDGNTFSVLLPTVHA